MVGIFFGCCAPTGKLRAKSKAPRRQSPNCLALSAERLALWVKTVTFFMSSLMSSSTRYSTLDTHPFSFDDSVRKHQHVRRDGDTNLFRGLKINHQLELRRQLHR